MSKTPHYHGHRQRLRERLLRDPLELADYELLELLLGVVITRRDTKPLAKELLKRFGTLRGVMNARPEELRKVEGFGPALEAFWSLWREMWARVREAPVQERTSLTSPQEVAELAMARLGNSPAEEFWMVAVDNKNRLMGWERISKGTVDQAPVYVREVLAMALKRQASGIILVHNHPGGDPKPSAQDVELTKRLVSSSRDLGIRVLDHLVVTDGSYYSFQAEGRI
jgi:DNA repair protein RadC